MKTRISLFSMLIAGSLFVASCNKHHKGTHSVQTINATVDMNKSYQFDLGSVGPRESAEISQQAQHYNFSETSDVNGKGHFVYNYMPALNYTGTDQVSITVGAGHHHDCGAQGHNGGCQHSGCQHSGCQHSDDDDCGNSTTYVIKINVTRAANSANTASAKAGIN